MSEGSLPKTRHVACCVPQCNTKSNEVVMEFAQDESADATATCSLVEMRLCAHASPGHSVRMLYGCTTAMRAHPRASASRLLPASPWACTRVA